MFRAVGFYAAACLDVVLQTWLCKDADVGREVELEAEPSANRPLQWSMECGLVAESYRAVDIVVRA